MIDGWEKQTRKNKILPIVIIVMVVALVIVGILIATSGDRGKEETKKTNVIDIETEDPESIVMEELPKDEEESLDISKVIDLNMTDEITYGIDVSRYQGTIDWKQVADAGIDFAMVRVGYRGLKNGKIVADSNAKYNMQEAQKCGIKVGAYFFSTATSQSEAIGEANWVADYIAKYSITYPVAYNCEGFERTESRQHHMTNAQRTDMALAFLEQIQERGYSPMFYASKDEMENNAKWEMDRVSSIYNVWVAQYPTVPYPDTASSDYTGSHMMWQYTSRGKVPGIQKQVDMNIAYFGYAHTQDAQDSNAPENVGADVEALMNFTDVNETVTAKEKTNLRNKPSQGEDSSVVYTLSNGEVATRTGVSGSGWSRVAFNGNTYYAVTSYLTTDLSYRPPQAEADDGIKTEFTEVNEQVTAKEAVNLRTIPSVTNAESKVIVQIVNGDVVTRTGINTELGWSRVVYNGQTLYCVSSYLKNAE